MFSTKNVIHFYMDTVLRLYPEVGEYSRLIAVFDPVEPDLYQVDFEGLIVHEVKHVAQKDYEFEVIRTVMNQRGRGNVLCDYEVREKKDGYNVAVKTGETVVLTYMYERTETTHQFRPKISSSFDHFILHTLVRDFAHICAEKDELIVGTNYSKVCPSLDIPKNVSLWVSHVMKGSWRVGNVEYKDWTRGRVVHVTPNRVDPPEAVLRIAGYMIFDPESKEPWVAQRMINARDCLTQHKKYAKRTVEIMDEMEEGCFVLTVMDHRGKPRAHYGVNMKDAYMENHAYVRGPAIYMKEIK